jgi:hypothetical protein
MRAMTIAVCVLGAVAVVAAIGEGHARFTGLRWNFTLTSLPPRRQTPPLRSPGSPAPAPLPQAAHGTPVWLTVVLWILVAAAIVAVLWVLARRVPRPGPRSAEAVEGAALAAADDDQDAAPADDEPDAPALRRGIAEALQILGSEREPRDAIVKAWLGLQESAEDAGIVRRPSETPTEFTGRILGRVTSDRESVAVVLQLYLRIRFGDHAATEADVVRVRAALTRLAESWKAEARA